MIFVKIENNYIFFAFFTPIVTINDYFVEKRLIVETA